MSIEKFTGAVLLNERINLIEDLESLGMYAYLSSKPYDWEIDCNDIMNKFHISKPKALYLLEHLTFLGIIIKEK
jgi:hypothetical protein